MDELLRDIQKTLAALKDNDENTMIIFPTPRQCLLDRRRHQNILTNLVYKSITFIALLQTIFRNSFN